MLEEDGYSPAKIADARRYLVEQLLRLERYDEAISYASALEGEGVEELTLRARYGKAAALYAAKDYAAAAACYPRQARALEESLDALHRAEEAGTENLDEAAGTTGRFLAEIFAWKEDFWQDDLRRLGFYLGKFIYLADAYEDLEKDRKSGSYNVLLSWERQTGSRFEQETEAVLTDTMAQAARAYERLPIVRRADILGNIIYSGVWLRYGAARRRRETPEGSR